MRSAECGRTEALAGTLAPPVWRGFGGTHLRDGFGGQALAPPVPKRGGIGIPRSAAAESKCDPAADRKRHGSIGLLKRVDDILRGLIERLSEVRIVGGDFVVHSRLEQLQLLDSGRCISVIERGAGSVEVTKQRVALVRFKR